MVLLEGWVSATVNRAMPSRSSTTRSWTTIAGVARSASSSRTKISDSIVPSAGSLLTVALIRIDSSGSASASLSSMVQTCATVWPGSSTIEWLCAPA